MGLFSAIKAFFDPGLDEPWREEYKRQEAERKAQHKVDQRAKNLSQKKDLSEDEIFSIHSPFHSDVVHGALNNPEVVYSMSSLDDEDASPSRF